MRVCLLPTDRWGVGSYRVLYPGRELERRGHDVFLHVTPFEGRVLDGSPVLNTLGFREDGSLEPSFDADVYVLQRRMERFMPTVVRTLRRLGRRVVCETDDLLEGIPPGSPAADALERSRGLFSVRAMNESFAFADLVTVSTPALAERYGRLNRNVVVLPNYLDWGVWENVVQQSEVERPKVRVGWMGWLAWRGDDLEQLRSWIGPWLRRNPQVEFVSIGEQHGNKASRRKTGDRSVHDYLGVPKGQRVTVHMQPFDRLNEIVPTLDIGLVPLERNDFNECKSWLKGLEYAACGVPCVATPTQQYRDFVQDGEDGLLADTAAEWQASLDLLVNDDALRRDMGRAARRKAATMTVQDHAHLWETAWAGESVAVAA